MKRMRQSLPFAFIVLLVSLKTLVSSSRLTSGFRVICSKLASAEIDSGSITLVFAGLEQAHNLSMSRLLCQQLKWSPLGVPS